MRETDQPSANPRSPESGDVPEPPDEWFCNKCGYFGAGGPFHQRGGNGLAERCEYMAGETTGSKQRREIARLTAELSTARERADRAERAEQEAARRESDDSARLEFLQDEHDRLDPVVKLVAKRDFDRNSSEWVEIVAVIETLDAARTAPGATND